MTVLKAQGQLIAATADHRLLRFLLLPFNEPGHTSAGLVEVAAGAVTLPEDPASLLGNLEHEPGRPVSRATALEETEDGLELEVRVFATTAGSDLLVEAAEGARTGVSVEIEDPVIRKGHLISGALTGYGHVTRPAFPSAQLITAADCGPDPSSAALEASTSEAPATDEPTEEGSNVDNATAPVELLSAASKAGSSADTSTTLSDVKSLITKAFKAGNPHLAASLTDNAESIFDDARQDQWIGEIWQGRTASTPILDLVSRGTLTARTVTGYKYVTKPTVSSWTLGGDPAYPTEVPTSTYSIDSVTTTASRFALGANWDRSYIDFGEQQYIDAFFRFGANDAARFLQDATLTKIAAVSEALTGTSAVSGISVVTQRIVDGYLHLLEDDVVPTFAIVGSDLWRTFLLTKKDEVLEYFTASTGLEAGAFSGLTLVPTSHASFTGKVVVGAKEAVTLYTLPASPIRVNALNVAAGTVTEAIYGYYALLDAGKGLVKVS